MVMCVRAPKGEAESFRSKLLAEGILSRDHRIRSDGNFVLIPVISKPEGMDVVDADLEVIEHKETDYRNLVDTELKEQLPSSFDVVGDVAIVKISDDVLELKEQIGAAILQTVGVRTVMMDSGVKGELRIRDLERIAGSGSSETVHKEFGVRMLTDPSKVYFNPRLATERMRIASLVRNGEIIIDMFAGVAPFPLVISKHSEAEIIYAIDLNEDAKEFMNKNIEMNKVTNVIAIQGDARSVMKDLPKADRIIMNLPQSAFEFLDLALLNINKNGMIHLHKIMDRSDLGAFTETLVRNAKENGFGICVKEIIELKTYSPTMSVYVFDIIRCD
jgi:Predicted methyltransferase